MNPTADTPNDEVPSRPLRLVHDDEGQMRSVYVDEACLATGVGRALAPEVLCATGAMKVSELTDRLLATGAPAVVVVDEEDRPVGIISRTDLLRAHHDGRVGSQADCAPAFEPSWDLGPLRARDIMTPTPISARFDEPPAQVLQRLETHGVHQLPVVDGEGRVIGLLGSVEAARLALLVAHG